MKRILYLEHNIDGSVGGSHYCLLEICRGIDRSRFQPVVCFYQENSLIPEFRATGAEIVIRSVMRPVRLHSRLAPRLAAFAQAGINMTRALVIRSVQWMLFLVRNRISLVHLNNACGYDHDLMLAAWCLRIPCVVHERGIQPRLPPATLFFSQRIDRIITISDVVHQNLICKGIQPEKLQRINDGIDPSRLTQETPAEQLRKAWQIPEQAPVIGIVGNLKHWKGQETVVRAVILLRQQFPMIRCFVVGRVYDTDYKDALDALVREHGLESNIIFTGYQKRPSDLMALFDVCVHASIEPEPFGIVLLEAMGKHKPVIATNIGGPVEILIDGATGYLTPPGDDKILASRISQLLADPELKNKMGKAAYERMQSHFTVAVNLQKIESLYSELLHLPPASPPLPTTGY